MLIGELVVSEFINQYDNLIDISDEEIENHIKCTHGILLKDFCIACHEENANKQRERDISQHYYGGRI